MNAPETIIAPNISIGWARIFISLYEREFSASTPIVLSIAGNDADAILGNAIQVRTLIDSAIAEHKLLSPKMNASLIFPEDLWRQRRHLGRLDFYRFYCEEFYPRLRCRGHGKNSRGTYFLRMIGWELPQEYRDSKQRTNQLEHLISMYKLGNDRGSRPRVSALQLAILDPQRDLNGAIRSIFPCLQQISIAYDNENGFSLSAFYPSQYIFDRGYGNYLGLAHLGGFIAEATSMDFRRLTVVVDSPKIGTPTKSSLDNLVCRLRDTVGN